MAIQDTDIFVVQRGEQAYKMPATQLNDYVEVEAGPSTDTLKDVCDRGLETPTCNRDMIINGRLTFIDGTSQTTAAVTKIQAGNNVTISPSSGTGTVTINASGGNNSTPGLGTVCAVNSDASAHSVSFRGVVCGNNITAGGKIEGAAGTKILANGAIQSVVTYNTQPGGLPLYINDKGYMGSHPYYKRSAATNITSLDTSNFITALKALTLYSSEQAIPEDQRQYQSDPDAVSHYDFGLFVEDIESSTVKDVLTNLDGGERRFNERHYSHFLFGVCKQQQQLIENLTTRIEQLEADHTAAMGNMQNNGGY